MAFKPATNESAFLKAGFLGFTGSGKTYTAAVLLIAFHKFCKSKKPIYMCDTETGSDWVRPLFDAEKIPFEVDKTRSFKTLMDDIHVAEKEAFGLIIDSVTHYWRELMSAYQQKLGVKRLSMHHWGPIKDEWGRFSDAYVNSKLHVVVCGRAGWDWDQEFDEDGHKELVKKGTKMKVEGEFGFEPNLLIELERHRENKIGAELTHLGHVLKDRRVDKKTLDGKTFEWRMSDPRDKVFKDLFPHIEWLNLGGDHLGVDTSSDSTELFDNNGKPAWKKESEQKTIIIEEIEGFFQKTFPGQSAKEKKAKILLAEKIFLTNSWTKVQSMKLDELKNCFEQLKIFLSFRDNIEILLGDKNGDFVNTNHDTHPQGTPDENPGCDNDVQITPVEYIQGYIQGLLNQYSKITGTPIEKALKDFTPKGILDNLSPEQLKQIADALEKIVRKG